MTGWETLLAALGGMVFGAGLATLWLRSREGSAYRQRLTIAARVRRRIVPLLEQRADQLGIPPSERGLGLSDPIEVAFELARVIHSVEQSADLPFKDTVEASASSLHTPPATTPPKDRP